MSDATVILREVSKSYARRPAVTGVDLALHPGERIALVGHNGAGKSTLIKLMLGLIRPTVGHVRVLSEDPADRRAIRARQQIGYLPENVALPPTMTGEELLAFYARLKHRPVGENAQILERVGIAHAARWRIGTYSKGMRQRLALAQALIGLPRVLLLDEPTTGLDPALRQTFYGIVRDLSAQGATVLLSSHALAELEGHADRIVVMNEGRKVADGSLADLRRQARRPVRIRLTLNDDHVAVFPRIAGANLVWNRVGERTFEVWCAEHDKVATIRQFVDGCLPVADLDVIPPTLDDIYAHFLGAEAAE
jgi:Cu-processing system ATP-binding protein